MTGLREDAPEEQGAPAEIFGTPVRAVSVSPAAVTEEDAVEAEEEVAERSGGEPDSTVGEKAAKVVFALAWPVVALNALQVVNTLIDRRFIGHLENAALTGHGGATNVMFFSFSLAVALAAGPTAIVSRAFGAKNPEEYQDASRQSLAVSVYIGLVVAALIYLISGPAAAAILPSTDRAAIAYMAGFTRLYALGLPALFVVQTLAASLRGIGDTKSPMVISGIQIGFHVALNTILIPRYGLNGAAIALSTSAWISAVIYVFFAYRTPLRTKPSLMPPKPAWAMRLLRVASPAAAMSALRVLSLTAFTVVLALGADASNAIAAMTTAFAIESVLFAPAFGMSAAAGTLVGQSLGRGDPRRAERLAWMSVAFAVGAVLLFIAPVAIFTPQIAESLLGDKPLVIGHAVRLIRLLCLTEILFGTAMVLFGAMQGAGDTVRPFWISVVSLWGLRVPLALFLTLPAGAALGYGIALPFGAGLGPNGAWIAMSFTQGLQGILAILAFRAGAWKTRTV